MSSQGGKIVVTDRQRIHELHFATDKSVGVITNHCCPHDHHGRINLSATWQLRLIIAGMLLHSCIWNLYSDLGVDCTTHDAINWSAFTLAKKANELWQQGSCHRYLSFVFIWSCIHVNVKRCIHMVEPYGTSRKDSWDIKVLQCWSVVTYSRKQSSLTLKHAAPQNGNWWSISIRHAD